jgi:hypothetical protein
MLSDDVRRVAFTFAESNAIKHNFLGNKETVQRIPKEIHNSNNEKSRRPFTDSL